MKNPISMFRHRKDFPMLRSPFAEFESLQRQMEKLFEDYAMPMEKGFSEEIMRGTSFSPTCDVEETDTAYLMTFELPGVKKEDIKISLTDNRLIVSGERKEEKEEKNRNRVRNERFFGSFERAFALPSTVKTEEIEASYSDGVLRLEVPKKESAKAHFIRIGDGKNLSWHRPKSVPNQEKNVAV